MIDRRERTAFASGRDVGWRKCGPHRFRRRRRARPIAELAGRPARGRCRSSGHAGRRGRPARGEKKIASRTPRPPRHGRPSQALELELRASASLKVATTSPGGRRRLGDRERRRGPGLGWLAHRFNQRPSTPSIDVPLMTPIAVCRAPLSLIVFDLVRALALDRRRAPTGRRSCRVRSPRAPPRTDSRTGG